jgi:hypothetical protein
VIELAREQLLHLEEAALVATAAMISIMSKDWFSLGGSTSSMRFLPRGGLAGAGGRLAAPCWGR